MAKNPKESEVKMVKEHVTGFYQIDKYGGCDVDEVIRGLTEIKEQNPQYTRLTVELDCYDDYGSRTEEVVVYGYRPENEKEKEKRLSNDKKQNDAREKMERKQFEELKKKFGEPK